MTGRVLIAEDDPSLRRVLGIALSGRGLDVEQVDDGGPAMERLREGAFDVAVLDVRLGATSGLDVLRATTELSSPPHVIVITAQNTMSNAIEAMKGGAYEYLCKPFDLEEFEALVLRALADRRLTADREAHQHPDGRVLYGRSPAMQQVFKAIGRAAASPHAVLVTGESGTGKELVARILHSESSRAKGPFVAVNAAAIPADLLESDLFGHAKGAFTGAHAARPGKFGAADGGTLFLDEIGEMPPGLQAKLLRVLEQKCFYPVGSAREVRVDVRIVAATNRYLAEEVRSGRFRGDLFYRLNVLNLHLPPLRNRREDIPQLARWLLRKQAAELGVQPHELGDDALEKLLAYTWPGNVRELENALVRASTFAQGGVIHADDLDGLSGVLGNGDDEEGFEDVLRRHLEPVVRTWDGPGELPSDLHGLVVGKAEEVLLTLALERTRGNQLRAAKLLGINRNTLKRKIDEYAIDCQALREDR